ncbi:hypothetical protein CFC21_014193 [Triticum aestivum]|uniref:Uncharacterized protein n=3 Tax=Triticinae TaxID=1648030 RepID=A0A9R1DUJ3_WHEAT|nr:uncharacterized protein LOC109764403 [Aegilops tauschii subsp. strangulata]XP_044447480.1 uncharacterized protein LOC123179281 [Triticum aestivum]KAF6998034.1 hypothetical protein CFC21_014192 [Triticum aestivum]KAF6998035.1 hypothetical protein CFC21_014193 [Triticum aestivum]
MAAVRCAARSLGGSLLQRTQAAVAEEGRLLAPSRLMRSRQLSSQVSGERSQVPDRLLLETGRIMRNRQLASEISKRLQEPSALESEVQCRMETLRASWHNKLDELHKEAAPDAFELYVKAYGNAAKAVVRGAAKALFGFSLISSLIFELFGCYQGKPEKTR